MAFGSGRGRAAVIAVALAVAAHASSPPGYHAACDYKCAANQICDENKKCVDSRRGNGTGTSVDVTAPPPPGSSPNEPNPNVFPVPSGQKKQVEQPKQAFESPRHYYKDYLAAELTHCKPLFTAQGADKGDSHSLAFTDWMNKIISVKMEAAQWTAFQAKAKQLLNQALDGITVSPQRLTSELGESDSISTRRVTDKVACEIMGALCTAPEWLAATHCRKMEEDLLIACPANGQSMNFTDKTCMNNRKDGDPPVAKGPKECSMVDCADNSVVVKEQVGLVKPPDGVPSGQAEQVRAMTLLEFADTAAKGLSAQVDLLSKRSIGGFDCNIQTINGTIGYLCIHHVPATNTTSGTTPETTTICKGTHAHIPYRPCKVKTYISTSIRQMGVVLPESPSTAYYEVQYTPDKSVYAPLSRADADPYLDYYMDRLVLPKFMTKQVHCKSSRSCSVEKVNACWAPKEQKDVQGDAFRRVTWTSSPIQKTQPDTAVCPEGVTQADRFFAMHF